jgi:hypothetical protein
MRKVLVLSILTAIVKFASPAIGQDFTFQQIAWNSPSGRVSQMMFALGYHQSETTGDGDIWFSGLVGERVIAQISQRGLFRVARIWEVPGPEVQSRFRALADSLTRIYGLPDSASVSENVWASSQGALRLHYDEFPSEGEPRIVIAHTSPTALSEIVQRMRYLADRIEEERQAWATSRVDRSRWSFLYIEDSTAVSYDLTRTSNPSTGLTRVWLRWDSREARPLHRWSSVMYEHLLEQREVRCTTRTWRSGEQHFYLGNQVVESASDGWTEWSEPIPDSIGEAVLSELCAALRRRR